MLKGQEATLGCGTLILIAMIVIVFGNMGGNDCAKEIRALKSEIHQMDDILMAQKRQIKSLEGDIERLVAQGARSADTSRPAPAEAP